MVVTLGQQYYVGDKPTVILHIYIINSHAGTSSNVVVIIYCCICCRDKATKWLNFTYSRSHAFRYYGYGRKNTNSGGKSRTHDFRNILLGVQVTY